MCGVLGRNRIFLKHVDEMIYYSKLLIQTILFWQMLSFISQFIENPPEKAKQLLSSINCPTLYEALVADRHLEKTNVFTTVYQLMQVS